MNYSKKYLNSYLTQILSIILNLLAILIVTPRLAAFPDYLGVYTLATSLISYLAYGDLGFLMASTKLAAEAYARNSKKDLAYIGFAAAISLVAWIIFAFGLVAFWRVYSEQKLTGHDDAFRNFFSYVMLTLICFSPVLILRRIVQIFYAIRLEDYYLRVFFAFGSLIKILGSFYIVKQDPYGVGHYFLFGNGVDLLLVLVCFGFSFRRYGYSLTDFIKSIRLDPQIFRETKGLATAGLLSTVCWILFFELDSLFLATFGSLEQVGLMTGCLMLVGYLRMLLGIIYSPFAVRFNYFSGHGDWTGLKQYCRDLIEVTFPVSVFFVLSIVLLVRPLMVSWLGGRYAEASLTTSFFVASFMFSFAQYPGSFLLITLERNREIALAAIFSVVVYWLGIIFLFDRIGILAIGIFKLISFVTMFVFYMYKIIEFVHIDLGKSLRAFLMPAILVAVMLVSLNQWVTTWLSFEKSYLNVLKVVLIGAVYSVCSILIFYILSRAFREAVKRAWTIAKDAFFKKKLA